MTTYNVVVVEDDVESLNLVVVSLVTSGFEAKPFQDGAAAWAYMKNNPDAIDVIILAKTLPNISGMELLHKIQENKSLQNIPVIIQTIDVEEGKAASAIEQGAQFYIHKPIDPKQVIRWVKAAIRSRKTSGNGGGSFVEKVRNS